MRAPAKNERAGTVHGFQGSERDTVIISLGVGPDDLSTSLRFIEDPGLFNVIVTKHGDASFCCTRLTPRMLKTEEAAAHLAGRLHPEDPPNLPR